MIKTATVYQLRNRVKRDAFGQATAGLFSAEYGFDPNFGGLRPKRVPHSFYFGHDTAEHSFPFQRQETLESFIGAQASAANSPDEDHPLYPKFVRAATEIFERFQVNDEVTVHGETHLTIDSVT